MKQQKVSDKVKGSLSPVVAKHTPGPWNAVCVPVVNNYDPRHVKVRGADSVKLIAKAYYGETNAECIANARLIASAPDLLDALKAAKEDLEAINEDCFGPMAMPTPTLQKIENALRKAEGRE